MGNINSINNKKIIQDITTKRQRSFKLIPNNDNSVHSGNNNYIKNNVNHYNTIINDFNMKDQENQIIILNKKGMKRSKNEILKCECFYKNKAYILEQRVTEYEKEIKQLNNELNTINNQENKNNIEIHNLKKQMFNID
tara:strand:- start:1170 stop:1583 length:414 start_codon:yes stop_codon:yes gene_type:complete